VAIRSANHGFRKFFQTQFTGTFDGSKDIANILAGHGTDIEETYTKKTREEMGQYYLRAEHKLLVEIPKEIIEKTEQMSKESEKRDAEYKRIEAENRRIMGDQGLKGMN
jgi:hypothetical protein